MLTAGLRLAAVAEDEWQGALRAVEGGLQRVLAGRVGGKRDGHGLVRLLTAAQVAVSGEVPVAAVKRRGGQPGLVLHDRGARAKHVATQC